MGQRKSNVSRTPLIHSTAIIDPSAKIGKGVQVWAFAQIRDKASIGVGTMIGNGVYIDSGVRVGSRCNIHNKALLYRNLRVGDEVFIGPGVCFTNDPLPRANKIRSLKGKSWSIKKGASIGANSTILSDISIGSYAVVGAGSVVTHDIPDHVLAYGNPARFVDFVGIDGKPLVFKSFNKGIVTLKSRSGNFKLKVKKALYEKIKG